MRAKERVSCCAPNMLRGYHMLDEQQEKELEYEAERVFQSERPKAVIPCEPQLSTNIVQFLEKGDTNLLDGDSFVAMSKALEHTRLFRAYHGTYTWANNFYVTRDFINVVECVKNNDAAIEAANDAANDDYLRPVWWIARTKIHNQKFFICLSTYECNRLMDIFNRSEISTLFMFRPRLSRSQSYLSDEDGLRVSGKTPKPPAMRSEEIVPIAMFAGSMYFETEDEQDAYCAFMGLIPRPRPSSLNRIGLILANGYVDIKNRQHADLKEYVGNITFTRNPVDLANGIIEARHGYMYEYSHVAAILKKGMKTSIKFDDYQDDAEIDNIE